MGFPVRVVRVADDDWRTDDDGGTRVEAVDIVDIASESLCWGILSIEFSLNLLSCWLLMGWVSVLVLMSHKLFAIVLLNDTWSRSKSKSDRWTTCSHDQPRTTNPDLFISNSNSLDSLVTRRQHHSS